MYGALSDSPAAVRCSASVTAAFEALKARYDVRMASWRFTSEEGIERHLGSLRTTLLHQDLERRSILRSARVTISNEELEAISSILQTEPCVIELGPLFDSSSLQRMLDHTSEELSALCLEEDDAMLWHLHHLRLFAKNPSLLVIIPIHRGTGGDRHFVGMDIIHKDGILHPSSLQ